MAGERTDGRAMMSRGLGFKPKRILLTQAALAYPMTQALISKAVAAGIDVVRLKANRVTGIPGDDPREAFVEAKQTLVVKLFNRKDLQSCRPSANFQLPLASGCPGHCHYCYLNTSFGPKPYVRVYPNLDDIWTIAGEYIEARRPKVTLFEGAATSDLLSLERWTGAVRQAILHFARHRYGRFRVATKYTDIDALLDLDHQRKTRIRYSLNTHDFAKRFEKGVPSIDHRIEAVGRLAAAGYPTGVLIGPIFLEDDWERKYEDVIRRLRAVIPAETRHFTFELITHRFTPRAKEIINLVYPDNVLPMEEEARRWKHGQFGYGKWTYEADEVLGVERFFRQTISRYFPSGKVVYVV